MLKIYGVKLLIRIIVFAWGVLIYVKNKSGLIVSDSLSLANGIQPLHILWMILAAEIIQKFFPKARTSIGCRKHFKANYAPNMIKPAKSEITAWIKTENTAAKKVFALWFGGNLIIAALYYQQVLSESEMVMLTLCYYIGDLICVLLYCPFQFFIMKNRCCITCRIFNWDSLMIVTPLIFIPSFFSWSLVFLATLSFIRWESVFHRHPQRFWGKTNDNLKCGLCEEKLCLLKSAVYNRQTTLIRNGFNAKK